VQLEEKKKKKQVIYRGRATTTKPKKERITADVSSEIMQEWGTCTIGIIH